MQVPRENRITRGMQGTLRASRVLRVSRSTGISPALSFLASRGQLLESWLAPTMLRETRARPYRRSNQEHSSFLLFYLNYYLLRLPSTINVFSFVHDFK